MTGATTTRPSRATGRSAIRPSPSVIVVPPTEWNPSTGRCPSEVTANRCSAVPHTNHADAAPGFNRIAVAAAVSARAGAPVASRAAAR